MAKDYFLTSEQTKAVESLQRALKKCDKANVYLWDNSDTITAVNGNVVSGIMPKDKHWHEDLGPEMEEQIATILFAKCWKGSNVDDTQYVIFYDDTPGPRA